MPERARRFRSDDSLEAERAARAAIPALLTRHGFTVLQDQRTERGSAVTQIVTARNGHGDLYRMHVRLCWRRDGRNPREASYSAAQLRARLIGDDWERTLSFIRERDEAEGNTHTLIAQFDQGDFVHAALVPCDQVKPIWERQRDISADLILRGLSGRRGKNHAQNGASPTIYLQDDRAPAVHAVADALWSWPGVVNVLALPATGEPLRAIDDTFDDCPADVGELGRDIGAKVERIRSGYPRDGKVRAAVLRRAAGACEREGCGERRDFAGFLDVHHILGVGTSDRVWNCVALCPNCHREAHFAPDRDAINAGLGELVAALPTVRV